jgi:hypothetical protein
MANVNGNWKGGKSLVKYSRTRALKAKGTKAAGKIARNYKRYVGPSAKLARGIGKLGLGVGKTLLRFPGTALIGTGLYYGGKAIVKKGERVAKRSATKQWHKRDRFARTRWYL